MAQPDIFPIDIDTTEPQDTAPGTKTRKTRSDKGQPRGSRGGTGGRISTSARRAKEQIAALVAMMNLGINSVSPDDALSDAEMTLLTDALTAEATNNARILAWLSRASGASAHLLLLTAIVTIALPRLARRGIIPATLGDAFNDTTRTTATQTPVPMGTGGTYGDNGRDGFGQDYASKRPTDAPSVHDFTT